MADDEADVQTPAPTTPDLPSTDPASGYVHPAPITVRRGLGGTDETLKESESHG